MDVLEIPTNLKKLMTQKNSVKSQTPRKESATSTLPELSDSEAVVPQRRKGRPAASGTGAAHTARREVRRVRRLQAQRVTAARAERVERQRDKITDLFTFSSPSSSLSKPVVRLSALNNVIFDRRLVGRLAGL